MAAKLAAFFVTLGINIVIGVAGLFFLLLAMNGFSESDANYGLVAYILFALFASVLFSFGAYGLVSFLLRRDLNKLFGVVLSVAVFSITGAISCFVAGLIGVGVAEFVRVNY